MHRRRNPWDDGFRAKLERLTLFDSVPPKLGPEDVLRIGLEKLLAGSVNGLGSRFTEALEEAVESKRMSIEQMARQVREKERDVQEVLVYLATYEQDEARLAGAVERIRGRISELQGSPKDRRESAALSKGGQ